MYRLLLIPLIFTMMTSCSSDSSSSSSNTEEQHLRLSSGLDPVSLDPRKVSDLPTITVLHMLYEGLTRASDGRTENALADTIEISPDGKTYTVTLKPALWSNGDPVTANDFVETWQSVLSPDFPSPNAYQLYVIRGAKEAKDGKIPVESIGVEATSPNTLVIDLENPTPYFQKLLATHFFYPVHASMRSEHKKFDEEKTIGNGPFKLDRWNQRSEFSVVKNSAYRDVQNVHLDRISVLILDENTALKLFLAGEIDWMGSPLSTLPREALATFKESDCLLIKPGSGTHWFRLNTAKPPFNNEKIRRAFGLAMNRADLVNFVTKGNQIPATGVIPPSILNDSLLHFQDNDQETARRLFKEGISELSARGIQFPNIELSYVNLDYNHKIVQTIQQQLRDVLGVVVFLDANESKMMVERLSKGNYQMGYGSWYADFPDAVNFLEIFSRKENPTNQTRWSDPEYTALIEKSILTQDKEQRKEILLAAQKKLIDSMPVIPLYHASYNYLKKDYVTGVYFSELGYLDFKEASLDR